MDKALFSVNVVIVTYNRKDLLKKTLKGIVSQTYPIKKIIVINNASTDGTDVYLEETSKSFGCFVIKNLPENIGGAGGFHAGIAEAYREECDYVWIMDDDCICTPTALEELINAYCYLNSMRKPIGFLSSNVKYKDGQPCLMNINKPTRVYNEFIDKGIVQISHTSFVAMLIPSSIVKEVGLPYKEYFIWGDDVEYSTRILQKYSGYLIGTSVVYHYMNENKGVDIFNTSPERIGRYYYFYRNRMHARISRNKIDGFRCLYGNIKTILRILFSRTPDKGKKISVIMKASIDGMLLRASIDYV